MKSYRMYCLLSIVLFLASCVDDYKSENQKEAYAITAQIEQNGTRTAVNAQNQVVWTEGDQIGVFGDLQTNNALFELEAANGSSARFTGELASGEQPDVAYYPYQSGARLQGSALSFELPAEYVYSDNSNAPMIGYSEGENALSFKHLCGLMKVTVNNVPEESVQFVVTSEGDNPKGIAGTAVVADVHQADAILAVQDDGNTQYSITYQLTGSVSDKTLTFYIPIPVGEYEKLTVSLQNADGKVLFQKSTLNASIKRAVILSMPTLSCDEDVSYVLADNTIQYSRDDEAYIFSVESEGDGTSDLNVLTFAKDTPRDKLPKVGSVLLYSEITEKFPAGFLGKVTSVDETNEGYAVHTEAAALDEAFDKLDIDKEFDLFSYIPDDVLSQYGIKKNMQTKVDVPVRLTFPLNVSMGFPAKKPFAMAGATGSFTMDSNMRFITDIDGKEQSNYLKIELDNHVSKSLTYSLSFTKGFEFPDDVRKVYDLLIVELYRMVPIPAGPIIISPKVIAGLSGSARGTGSVSFQINSTQESVSSIEIKDNNIYINNPTNEDEIPQQSRDLLINLKGAVGVGPKIGVVFDFFTVAMKGTIELSASLMMEMALEYQYDVSNAANGTFYSLVKDSKVAFTPYIELKGAASVDLFSTIKDSLELSPQFAFLTDEEYIVPSMENISINDSDESVITNISYEVIHNTLWPFEYGLKIYDEYGSELYSQLYMRYNMVAFTYPQNLKEPLTFTFANLEEGKKYIAKPFFTFLGNEIVTDISKEFMLEEEEEEEEEPQPGGTLTVISVNATDITKNSATLSGLIPDAKLDGTYEYGFMYGTSETLTAETATIVPVTTIQDNGSFSADISALTENTTYYWRAYVCDANEKYTYGDVKSFVTTNDPQGQMSERDILIAFFHATGGNNWIRKDNWCTDAPLEDWYGVVTEEEYYSSPVYAGKEKIKQIILEDNNLTGTAILSGLTELENIVLEGNQLTGMDFTGLPSLLSVHLSKNRISNLDLMPLRAKLERLSCDENLLTDLQVAGFDKLEHLECGTNQLRDLDLTGCISLKWLDCDENQLTNLDVSQLTQLRSINCNDNSITSLYVPNLKKLSTLYCLGNPLTDLKIDGCIDLDILGFGRHPDANIPQFDASQFVNLSQLRIYGCKMQNLTVPASQRLHTFYCIDNELTDIDVSPMTGVDMLFLDNNQLESLDVSNLEKLNILSCDENKLKNLDVSMLNMLSKLECSDNELVELKISPYMSELHCRNNQLKTLDMSISTRFKKTSAILCDNNYLEVVYLSSSQEYLISKFPTWGEQDSYIYKKPYHWNSYQYPEFIYK